MINPLGDTRRSMFDAASDPFLFSHHHLLLTPHRLQQRHARCRPPHPYERTNQPTATSTTPAGDHENVRGSNEGQEPTHRGRRVRKRDTTPPGMAQASLYDAADHPNSLLHRKWWLDAAEQHQTNPTAPL